MDLVKLREDLNVDYLEVKIALTALVDEFSELKVAGPDDAEGYTKAREVMKDAGKIRRNIEEKRKGHKTYAIALGKLVDEIPKELQAIINPLEDRLKAEVQAVDDYHEKALALKKAEAAWPLRRDKLIDLQYKNGEEQTAEEIERLKLMPDAEFLQICNELQSAKMAEVEKENQRLRNEAAERERIDNENKRVAAAAEQARKDALQETVNREAAAVAEQAVKREKEMQEKIWPLREDRIKALFDQYDVSHRDDRLRNLKPMVLKMDEPAFEKYMAEAKESAEAAVARKRSEMGDREKMADFYKQLLAVPVPTLSEGSIYQSDLSEVLGIIRDGSQVWIDEPVKV